MTDEIMQMYQLVLEGRALESLVSPLMLAGAITLILTTVATLYLLFELEKPSLASIVAMAGLTAFLAEAVACGVVKYYAALHPTLGDIKTVGAYKVGKQLIESEKTQRALDALINKLETKDHE